MAAGAAKHVHKDWLFSLFVLLVHSGFQSNGPVFILIESRVYGTRLGEELVKFERKYCVYLVRFLEPFGCA